MEENKNIITKILNININSTDSELISEAAEAINAGLLVGFPTETVYGLAASIHNPNALRRIYEVKGRPSNKPLPVQIANIESLSDLTDDIPEIAYKLMRDYFPGPLTIIFNALKSISSLITADTGKVGVRMPDHKIALELIDIAGVPIVAPSANTSGFEPPIDAKMLLADLSGKIDYVIDAGPCRLKIPSTVVDVSDNDIKIIREGVITKSELLKYMK